MTDLQEEIVLCLQCPACFQMMQSPIRMCSKGHDVCDSCARKYSVCVKCKYPYTTTHNLTLEFLSEKIDYNHVLCVNRSLLENMTDGQVDKDNIYKCTKEVLKENYSREFCKWSGSILDVYNHFKMAHTSSMFELSVGSKFLWKLPYKQNQIDFSVILMDNQKFLQVTYYDHENMKINYGMYNLNYKTTETHMYEIEINEGKHNKRFLNIVYVGYTHIKQLVQVKKCLSVSLDKFVNFNTDRVISWYTKIIKM